MSKFEKFKNWDKIFGFGSENWEYKKWPTKDTSTYYRRECPGIQISDPDLPF